MRHNRDNFSKIKLKGSTGHRDKARVSTLEDVTREKMLKGDLNREDCDEDNECKVLCLLKIRQAKQLDETK